MSRSAAGILRAAAGRVVVDEDGNEKEIRLSPPLSAEEVAALQRRIPCPLPPDARELLGVARGFEGGLESIDFSGLTDPIFEELFPCGLPIAHDGYGNYWIVDLTSQSTTWGPIFFVCHDPPVIVFQCDDIATFTADVLTLAAPPYAGPIDDVHERYSMRIWRENPGAVRQADALQSSDPLVRGFAKGRSPADWIIDLRQASTGDGFSWGRFGPKTVVGRAGEERLFACRERSRGSRLLGWLTGR